MRFRPSTFLQRVWFFLAIPALCSAGTVGSAEQAALNFLNQFPRISVVFVDSPGLGHLATTKLVLNRVRELGYTRPVDLYIDQEARAKLAALLPGYRTDGNPKQILSDINAVTHPLIVEKSLWSRSGLAHTATTAELKKRGSRFSVKRFALTGGDDASVPPALVDADAILAVEPTGWHRHPSLRLATSEYGNGAHHYTIIFPSKQNLVLKNLPPHPSDPARFVREEMRGSGSLEVKTAGLESLVKLLPEHEVLTAYGLSYRNGPLKLANILNSVQQVQLNPELKLKKGVVVPLLSNFNEKEWSEFSERAKKYPDLHVSVESVQAKNLVEKMVRLQHDEILVVKTGAVSQGVWNYLMGESTYPGIASGKTGIEFLSMKETPFFNSLTHTTGTNPETFDYIKQAGVAMERGDTAFLTRYMTDARKPESDISRAFAGRAAEVAKAPERVTSLVSDLQTDPCLKDLLNATIPEPQEMLDLKRALSPLVEMLKSY